MPRSPHHHIAGRVASRRPSALVARVIYVVAVAEPLANLPQIYTIYHTHTAAGVSITSWLFYALFAAAWLWYGINMRVRPNIVAGAMFLITDLSVVFGAIMYGGRW